MGDKKQLLFLILFTIVFQILIFSQSKSVDSLFLLVESTDNSKKKSDLLNEVAKLISAENPVKSIHYGQEAFKIALDIKYNYGMANVNIQDKEPLLFTRSIPAKIKKIS